jgi:hypothetical protein
LGAACGDADERAEQRVARVAHVVHSGAAFRVGIRVRAKVRAKVRARARARFRARVGVGFG